MTALTFCGGIAAMVLLFVLALVLAGMIEEGKDL